MSLLAIPSLAYAKPPTANSLTLDAAFAYGETFDSSLNHYESGLAATLGVTFRNGVYVGASFDLFPKHEASFDGMTLETSALRFGGAVGLDLKMAQTVTGRLVARAGYALLGQDEASGEDNDPVALDDTRAPYVGPALTLLLMLNEHVYLRAGAQLDVLLKDDRVETAAVGIAGFGIRL